MWKEGGTEEREGRRKEGGRELRERKEGKGEGGREGEDGTLDSNLSPPTYWLCILENSQATFP